MTPSEVDRRTAAVVLTAVAQQWSSRATSQGVACHLYIAWRRLSIGKISDIMQYCFTRGGITRAASRYEV